MTTPTSPPHRLVTPLTISAGVGAAIVGALVGYAGGPVVSIAIAVVFAAIALWSTSRLSANAAKPAALGAIDPFTVSEPWRRLTQDALRARIRFVEATAATPPGPLRDRLEDIAGSVESAVAEVWQNARAGHELSAAVRQLSPHSSAATRLYEQIEVTESRLRTANDELAATVGIAVEVSVSGSAPDEFNSIEQRMTAVTNELEAIHAAIEATSQLGGPDHNWGDTSRGDDA